MTLHQPYVSKQPTLPPLGPSLCVTHVPVTSPSGSFMPLGSVLCVLPHTSQAACRRALRLSLHSEEPSANSHFSVATLKKKEVEETVRALPLINSFPPYQCPSSFQIPLGSPRGSAIPRMRLLGLWGRVSVFVIKENASTMHSFVRGAGRGLPE